MGHSHIMTLQNNELIPAERKTRSNSQKFHRHQVKEKKMQEANKINQVTRVWNSIFFVAILEEKN